MTARDLHNYESRNSSTRVMPELLEALGIHPGKLTVSGIHPLTTAITETIIQCANYISHGWEQFTHATRRWN